jgi:hypothetical protein
MRRERNATFSSYVPPPPCHDSTARVGLGLLYEVPRLDTHTRQDSSRRVIGPSQGPIHRTQHKRQTSPARFEPAIPASKRPWTHALYISRGHRSAYTAFGSYMIQLLPLRFSHKVPLQRQHLSIRLHSISFQMAVKLIFTAIRTSNLMLLSVFLLHCI